MEEQQMVEGSLHRAAEALSEETLGRLLEKLRKKLNLPVGVDAQFTTAWMERNWVVHRFLHDAASTLARPDGLAAVISNLGSRKSVVLKANSQAESIADEYLAQFGADLEEVRNRAERVWAQLYQRPNPAASPG
jgi:hypothetical protein